MQFKRSLLAAATLALATVAPTASAKPFKWAGSSDIQTMDIHSQNSALGNGIHAAVYESLVMFNSRTLKVEPLLATSWQQVSPTQLRVKLRQGVKFSDGSAMTADDVVYSLQRAMSRTSTYSIYTQGMDRIAKVDGETIDIFLKNPNPVILNQLTELRVMSKAWAEKNNSVEPKDIKAKDETYSHRNAMGTGPFVLKEWVPDQKIVFASNPHWWNAGKAEGNVTEITYTPIKSEATRIAALLSGEVDMVRDTSIQDLARIKANPALKVMEMVENRTVYLAMDQFRDELVGSNIKGKNPLKDLRVRKALYQAIDIETIKTKLMRGQAAPGHQRLADEQDDQDHPDRADENVEARPAPEQAGLVAQHHHHHRQRDQPDDRGGPLGAVVHRGGVYRAHCALALLRCASTASRGPSTINRPLCIINVRSVSDRIGTRCVAMIAVRPFSQPSSRETSVVSSVVSSAAVGSSKITTCGSWSQRRAQPMDWRWPTERPSPPSLISRSSPLGWLRKNGPSPAKASAW